MCGICGILNFNRDEKVDESVVRQMCKVISHRGPDDEGVYIQENVGIGMRRLSIIDLSGGHQPICNEDGTVWIVFNGEIYNYQSVRAELIQKGHRFATNSDTETILHAFEEYGEACPEKLNGMFAFAIWDDRDKRLFVARDRLGIKPLYYYLDENCFIFGSELKSILQVKKVPRNVNPVALDKFLTFEYIPAPISIFKDIHKLRQGHTLLWDRGRINIRCYWDLTYDVPKKTSEAEICEELVDILQDAVKIRLMSEVPLGAFLSGGVDSSTVVALMSRVMNQPVKTFSIGFEDATYNELKYARIIAEKFKTEHHEFIIKPNAVDLTENLVKNYVDEPFADFSLFPTYLVSKMAREYVTVVLSGDGGDELFAGYDPYIANQMARSYDSIPRILRKQVIEKLVAKIPPTEKKKGLINRLKRFVEGAALPPDLQHVRWMIFLTEAEKNMLYSRDLMKQLNPAEYYDFIRGYFKAMSGCSPIDQQQYVDIKTYMVDDILVKVDRMSMATSLEARVPLIDYRVVEYATKIPGMLKLAGLSHQKTKYILKKAMERFLPHEILYRGKEGFSIPIKNWLKTDLKPLMMEVLSPENIKSEGFFNPEYVEQLKREHLNNVQNHSHRLWALMMFGIWYDIYIRRG
jgi:asparagine synthase (glutamine-hydrolysing)